MSGPLARVLSVSASARHGFCKHRQDSIRLVAGLGVEGDAHAGATVQHLSRLRRDPSEPNLRQVHLLHAELLDELAGLGYDVAPGRSGENITTVGVPLLELPTGTLVTVGDRIDAPELQVTGLRNPCAQIDDHIGTGALKQVLRTRADGSVERRVGVMAIVTRGGPVYPGDPLTITMPAEPHRPLAPV